MFALLLFYLFFIPMMHYLLLFLPPSTSLSLPVFFSLEVLSWEICLMLLFIHLYSHLADLSTMQLPN
uniref:Putative ovule protein n=1 Tax=Solanum chacoense TaxID=4108 RepID=A0A0V0HL25_SOLCH